MLQDIDDTTKTWKELQVQKKQQALGKKSNQTKGKDNEIYNQCTNQKPEGSSQKAVQNGICNYLGRCLDKVLSILCTPLCSCLDKIWWTFPIILTIADQISDITFVVEKWDEFPTTILRNLTLFFAFFQTIALACLLLYNDSSWIKSWIHGCILKENQNEENKNSGNKNEENKNQANKIEENRNRNKIINTIVRPLVTVCLAPLHILLAWLKIHEFTTKYKIELLKELKELKEQQQHNPVQSSSFLPMDSQTRLKKMSDEVKMTKQNNGKHQPGGKWSADKNNAEIAELSGQLFILRLFNGLFESTPELVVQSITNQRLDEWTPIAIISAVFSSLVIVYQIVQLSRTFRDQYGKGDKREKKKVADAIKDDALFLWIYFGLGLVGGTIVFSVVQIDQLWLVALIIVASSFYGYFIIVVLIIAIQLLLISLFPTILILQVVEVIYQKCSSQENIKCCGVLQYWKYLVFEKPTKIIKALQKKLLD